jgi:hypothetical protein
MASRAILLPFIDSYSMHLLALVATTVGVISSRPPKTGFDWFACLPRGQGAI